MSRNVIKCTTRLGCHYNRPQRCELFGIVLRTRLHMRVRGVHVCMHMRAYVHVHTRVHMYMCVRVRVYVCMCVDVSLCVYLCVCVYVCRSVSLCLFMRVRVCV